MKAGERRERGFKVLGITHPNLITKDWLYER